MTTMMDRLDTEVRKPAAPTFLWLEITGKCQLNCTHCYADSGPSGDHGSMTTGDWCRVIDQAADLGVTMVQFIGGEPTLHPDLCQLVEHALGRGLAVEVFSNLVHVTDQQWTTFARSGVSLATSYYSDDRDQHAGIVGRDTLRQTQANVAEALRRGIPLRTGVIDVRDGQRAEQARQQLVDLGVPRIGTDRLRQVGRGGGCAPGELCGGCGDGVAAVLPDGTVSPCVMSRWITAGDALHDSLATALAGVPAGRQQLIDGGMQPGIPGCNPDDCSPCAPQGNCYPYNRD